VNETGVYGILAFALVIAVAVILNRLAARGRK
jgi:hypothetical protein